MCVGGCWVHGGYYRDKILVYSIQILLTSVNGPYKVSLKNVFNDTFDSLSPGKNISEKHTSYVLWVTSCVGHRALTNSISALENNLAETTAWLSASVRYTNGNR